MSSSACVVCLIGLPGAGKTTLARNLKRYLLEKSFIVFVLEYDEWLILSESGTFREKRGMVLDRVRNTFIDMRASHVNSDCLLILDDNFYYRSMRYEVFRLARQFGNCSFAQVLLDQPVEICTARNASRGDRSVSVETIDRMNQLLEKPNPSKHVWERYSIVLNDFESDGINQVMDLVQVALLNPVTPLTLPKTVATESVSQIHQLDLALRKIVSRLLSTCSSFNISSESKRLASIKKELLFAIKCGEIVLPQLDSSADRLNNYCDFLMPYFHHEEL